MIIDHLNSMNLDRWWAGAIMIQSLRKNQPRDWIECCSTHRSTYDFSWASILNSNTDFAQKRGSSFSIWNQPKRSHSAMLSDTSASMKRPAPIIRCAGRIKVSLGSRRRTMLRIENARNARRNPNESTKQHLQCRTRFELSTAVLLK